jgi:hypothetical protein
MNTKDINTPDDFIKYCASQYIINQGPESIKALTKQLKQAKAFKNKESYSRLNRTISKITSIKSVQDDCHLIDEISKKLKSKALIYR